MSKIDTAKKIAKVIKKYPDNVMRFTRFAGLYGIKGLRDRIHDEIIVDELYSSLPNTEPGSVSGSILFSVIMPTYNVEKKWVEKAVESIKAQTYNDWELCIADDCSSNEELLDYLKSIQGDRIKIRFLEENLGISGTSNAATELASGSYLVLLDDDDELAFNALEELFYMVSATHADIIYSDNDVIDEKGKRLSLFLKPDWSYDLMMAQMYVGHLLAFKKSIFDEVGGFDSAFDGSQDYDLFLRMMEKTDSIEHIPHVLYSWRSLPSSTATNPDAKPYSQIAGLRAIQSHFDRTKGKDVVHVEETDKLFVYDVRWTLPEDRPLASIIIPTKNHVDDLITAVESIFMRTTYPNYEIIIIDNNSEDPKTEEYYSYLTETRDNVKIERANYPFNWSKVNNQGIEASKGEVIVCLNNDVVILTDEWLDRLVENALREDIGVVGSLLLYPDGTIQHAGVVVGLGGWADHIYKGAQPVHHGNPFVSPMVPRNVTAVTGACMAFSRSLVDDIGVFDEDFIVCGSDVEMCLRAIRNGYRNLYLPDVRLTHFESKTRNPTDIPKIDFELSRRAYKGYLLAGDPFFNKNLDYSSCIPQPISHRTFLKREKDEEGIETSVPEIRPIHFRNSHHDKTRINLMIPSLNNEDIFGGISTALNLFNTLVKELNCNSRIIIMDAKPYEKEIAKRFPQYEFVNMNDDSSCAHQIVSIYRRGRESSVPVGENDWFLCTSWWSAFIVQAERAHLKYEGAMHSETPLLYCIQDYEPGFYAWSSKYMLAESTYLNESPIVAIFNSQELKNYFDEKGYSFDTSYVFNPSLNSGLKDKLEKLEGTAAKRRQIVVYGRPNTDRNAFSLIIESLREWIDTQETGTQWDFVSAGEQHEPIPLGRGKNLVSVGKLTIDDYARLLTESYAGISLMVSPHPSYPPLEMASFGVQTITNAYSGKDLSDFSPYIHSLRCVTPQDIAHCLDSICAKYTNEAETALVPEEYVNPRSTFPFIGKVASHILNYRK